MSKALVPIEIEHEGQRVITTELLAQIYETDAKNIQMNFANHSSNFKEGIHYYLLQGEPLRRFKNDPNNIGLVGKNASSLYLWTERGANRHCKILDTPKAWEQFDNLEETYFLVKEHKKALRESAAAEKRAAAMLLNAKNRTASFLQRIYSEAGVKPEYQALALSDFYAVDGVNLPKIALQGTKVTYDKGAIAKKLGVYSKASGGKAPHAQAIGAIISMLEIADDEREAVPYSRNGHDGTDWQYTQSVVDKVQWWLGACDWSETISVNGKKYEIIYKR